MIRYKKRERGKLVQTYSSKDLEGILVSSLFLTAMNLQVKSLNVRIVADWYRKFHILSIIVVNGASP